MAETDKEHIRLMRTANPDTSPSSQIWLKERLLDTCNRLEAANEKIEQLKQHIWHKPDCAIRAGLGVQARPDKNCDCGYVEMLK